jgi:hypothetical protein
MNCESLFAEDPIADRPLFRKNEPAAACTLEPATKELIAVTTPALEMVSGVV